MHTKLLRSVKPIIMLGTSPRSSEPATSYIGKKVAQTGHIITNCSQFNRISSKLSCYLCIHLISNSLSLSLYLSRPIYLLSPLICPFMFRLRLLFVACSWNLFSTSLESLYPTPHPSTPRARPIMPMYRNVPADSASSTDLRNDRWTA